jgi:hypothetical protein
MAAIYDFLGGHAKPKRMKYLHNAKIGCMNCFFRKQSTISFARNLN